MKSKNLTSEKLDRFVEADRWIDYQKVFKERFKEHQVWKLEDALYFTIGEALGQMLIAM